MAAAARRHRREHTPVQVNGAKKFTSIMLPELVHRQLEEAPRHHHPRVVHEVIDRPLGEPRLHRPRDIVRPADVQLQDVDPRGRVLAPDAHGGLVEEGPAARHQRHRGAVPRDEPRERQPDAARTAGDENALALETQFGCPSAAEPTPGPPEARGARAGPRRRASAVAPPLLQRVLQQPARGGAERLDRDHRGRRRHRLDTPSGGHGGSSSSSAS